MAKTVIISLGGSLIVPDSIDTVFIKSFKKVIEKHVKKNFRFVIICGGGKTARNYQKALANIIGYKEGAMDWIGISATCLNAFLLRLVFYPNSDKRIVSNPNKKIDSEKKIILAGGWKPGRSTDYDAVLLAKNLKVKSIINMSNVDFVYDKDPKKYNNAKKIKNICWKHYKKIIGKKWKAGLNAPFDPIATKVAERLGLQVLIVGKDLDNLEKILSKEKFEGTIIK